MELAVDHTKLRTLIYDVLTLQVIPSDSQLFRFQQYRLEFFLRKLDVRLSVHRCICVEKKIQLDIIEWFIALIICSKCFGHFYAHHQELESICALLPPMVCSAWLLVVGGQVLNIRLCVQEERCCTYDIPLPGLVACCPAPDPRQPTTKHCKLQAVITHTYSLEFLMMSIEMPETC